jgi:hypothetical protein
MMAQTGVVVAEVVRRHWKKPARFWLCGKDEAGKVC